MDKVKPYIDKLCNMGVDIPKEQAIDLIFYSLPYSYNPFILNFNMRNLNVVLMVLSKILEAVEADIVENETQVPFTSTKDGTNFEQKMLSL